MNKHYNILIIHNEYQYAGGEDTVVRQDAALLEGHGHSVSFYIRNNEELRSMPFIKKILLPFTTVFSLKSYREIRASIRKNHIDIVHVHNTLPLISFSAYYAAKKEKVRLFQTLHNFRFVCPNALFYRDGHICEDCPEKGLQCSIKHSCYRGSKIQTLVTAFMLKVHRLLKTFEKPDGYIALTAFNKEKISSVVNRNKIFVKPNYLALSESAFLTADSPEALSLYAEKTAPYSYYIYAARLEKVKGIFVLLEAFRHLPKEKLLLLGTGPEEEEVNAYINTHQMRNIVCLGFVPHEETIRLVSKAKALIFPSLWYEGFPMTIVESLACSTPVIASDTPNLTETIHSGENGYTFATGSSAALEQTVSAFSALSKEESERIRERARKTYTSRFTEDIIYKKLMEIYEKLSAGQHL